MKRNKLGITLLAVMLSACSSGPKIIKSTNQDQAKKEIRFLTTTTSIPAVNTFNVAIEEFEKEQNDVRVLFEGYDKTGDGKSLKELINERVEHGRANDIVTMDVANIFEYVDQGKLHDLSDSAIAKQLIPAARQDSTINGKVMSLPLSMLSYGMWVNMDIMKACGLSIPNNWEEFLHCCEVLKQKGYQPLLSTRIYPKLFILATLSDIYQSDQCDEIIEKLNRGEEKVSTYVKKGFEHLQYLLDQGYIDRSVAQQYLPKEGKELYPDQENGVFMLGTSSMLDPDDLEFEIAFIGIPGNDQMVSLLASDRRMVVMEDSQYKKECLDFLGYLSNDKVRSSLSDIFGLIPAYQSDETRKEKHDPRLNQMYENIDAKRTMLIQDYSLCFEQWSNLDTLYDAMLAGASMESQLEAFDQLQAEAIAAKK